MSHHDLAMKSGRDVSGGIGPDHGWYDPRWVASPCRLAHPGRMPGSLAHWQSSVAYRLPSIISSVIRPWYTWCTSPRWAVPLSKVR